MIRSLGIMLVQYIIESSHKHLIYILYRILIKMSMKPSFFSL